MEGNLASPPICKVCGEPYETVRPSQQKYCSLKCKNKAAIMRRTKREVAARLAEIRERVLEE